MCYSRGLLADYIATNNCICEQNLHPYQKQGSWILPALNVAQLWQGIIPVDRSSS